MTDKYGDDHKLYKGHQPQGGTTTEKTKGASTDTSQSTYYANKSTYKAPAAVKADTTTYYRSYYRPQAASTGAMKLNYYYGTYTYWSYYAGTNYDYSYWYYDW